MIVFSYDYVTQINIMSSRIILSMLSSLTTVDPEGNRGGGRDDGASLKLASQVTRGAGGRALRSDAPVVVSIPPLSKIFCLIL